MKTRIRRNNERILRSTESKMALYSDKITPGAAPLLAFGSAGCISCASSPERTARPGMPYASLSGRRPPEGQIHGGASGGPARRVTAACAVTITCKSLSIHISHTITVAEHLNGGFCRIFDSREYISESVIDVNTQGSPYNRLYV